MARANQSLIRQSARESSAKESWQSAFLAASLNAIILSLI